jgi:hypothetical protein
MVEHIEIFGAHIEPKPFGQVETTAQRQIGLVDPIRAAQTVPWDAITNGSEPRAG